MSGTRCPNAFDKRPRYVAYVPVAMRLDKGQPPKVRVSMSVRTGRVRPSERR